MDSGTSFNGNPIEAIIKLHFNHLKSPRTIKRVYQVVLELDAPIDTFISASVEFDYGETGNASSFFNLESPGGVWDVNNWDAFVWDGRAIDSAPLDVDGEGLNFSLTIYHSGVWELQEDALQNLLGDELPFVFNEARTGLTGAFPHTIQGYSVIYSNRRLQR